MNLELTIIISLVASIVGGIISGGLVMRKNAHDNKRVYATQMYTDFKLMCEILLFAAQDYIRSLGYKKEEIKSLQYGVSVKSSQSLSKSIGKWLNASFERKTQKQEFGKLLGNLDELMEEILHETTGVESFISKYPLQIAYFDEFYRVQTAINIMKYWRKQVDVDVKTMSNVIYNSAHYLLEVIENLVKAAEDVEYYRNAQSWTWRLLIPTSRN